MVVMIPRLQQYAHPQNSSSTLFNSIFVSTVNTAAKMLVTVASVEPSHNKWNTFHHHLRFMLMLVTWLSVWFLRLLMDLLPSSLTVENIAPFSPISPNLPLALPTSHSSLVSSSSSSSSSHYLIHPPLDTTSVNSIARALSHVLAIVNEIPASSNKYQFVVGMVERIVEENARADDAELLQINHMALSSAFTRTSALLHHSLLHSVQTVSVNEGWWSPSRMVKALPLGSYISYCLNHFNVFQPSSSNSDNNTKRNNNTSHWVGGGGGGGGGEEDEAEVEAEKFAEELLWITGKLQRCGYVKEAVVQWSLASGLAGLSVTARPRVQGVMLKISAILVREMREPAT